MKFFIFSEIFLYRHPRKIIWKLWSTILYSKLVKNYLIISIFSMNKEFVRNELNRTFYIVKMFYINKICNKLSVVVKQLNSIYKQF